MGDIIQNRFFIQPESAQNYQRARIKVIGVGGGGSNAVDYMANERIEGVEFYVANTDAQALARSQVQHKVQFGDKTTRGLGAGSVPRVGRDAALEDQENIVNQLNDVDMVFITAGMGGGTGTGAAPVIAQGIKEAYPQVLIVAVVTTPFSFEGAKRNLCARQGLSEMKRSVDALITIPNDKIIEDGNLLLNDAYRTANDVLRDAVKGIADLVVRPGYMNVDFADVKTVMSEAGSAMMASGRASGENRARTATQNAIRNPLLADVNVAEARGMLVNITASSAGMSAQELQEIGDIVQEVASDEATIITGLVFDEELEEQLQVTIVATGLEDTIPDEQPEWAVVTQSQDSMFSELVAERAIDGHREDCVEELNMQEYMLDENLNSELVEDEVNQGEQQQLFESDIIGQEGSLEQPIEQEDLAGDLSDSQYESEESVRGHERIVEETGVEAPSGDLNGSHAKNGEQLEGYAHELWMENAIETDEGHFEIELIETDEPESLLPRLEDEESQAETVAVPSVAKRPSLLRIRDSMFSMHHRNGKSLFAQEKRSVNP